VQPQSYSINNTIANITQAGVYGAPTLTGANVQVTLPNAISLLGILPLQAAGNGITVNLLVIGN